MKQIFKSKPMKPRIVIDSKEEFFKWKNRLKYGEEGFTVLFYKMIYIPAELALEIYHNNPEDIDIEALQAGWDGKNLEYLFRHDRKLFGLHIVTKYVLNKANISDEFAEILASSDMNTEEWEHLVAGKAIPIEILLKHVHEDKNRWRAILIIYTDLGDEFLEKHWEEIKEYTDIISSYQQMSLEFMKAHEDELDLEWYFSENKYITEEILLYFKDKVSWHDIFYTLKNVSEEFLEAITPKYISYEQAYKWAFLRVADKEACNRLLLKYAAHLDKTGWENVCISDYLTKEVIVKFKDKIQWQHIHPGIIMNINGVSVISDLLNLLPKEYYENPDKFLPSWKSLISVGNYIMRSNNPKPIQDSDNDEKLPKNDKIDFDWSLFINWPIGIDIELMKKNLKQLSYHLVSKFNLKNIDLFLELIRMGEFNVENCPFLSEKVSLDILVEMLACSSGILRFLAEFGDNTYTIIDILKSRPNFNDTDEDKIWRMDIAWFLNVVSTKYYYKYNKTLYYELSEDPDIDKLIL